MLLWAFVAWQRHREAAGSDPLVHLDLLKIPPLRSGLVGLFTQNLILMGVFFTIPLYLQLVLGLDALETGIKMLPVSIAMFVAAAVGSRLSTPLLGADDHPGRPGAHRPSPPSPCSPRSSPTWPTSPSPSSMAVLGVGMGLIASQLGNVVQSSVDASGRGEAGGLQYTGQQLGSSLGVALIGAIVLAGLTGTFVSTHPGGRAHQRRGRGPGRRRRRVRHRLRLVRRQSRRPRSRPGSTRRRRQAIVDDYEEAQLRSLKAGLLAAALIALVSLAFTQDLPHGAAAGRTGGDPAGADGRSVAERDDPARRVTTPPRGARLADPLVGAGLPARAGSRSTSSPGSRSAPSSSRRGWPTPSSPACRRRRRSTRPRSRSSPTRCWAARASSWWRCRRPSRSCPRRRSRTSRPRGAPSTRP